MGRGAVIGLVLLAVGVFAPTAGASPADDTIVNQQQIQDATGDSGTGADLSAVTLTSYADGTISLAVDFANREFIRPNETVQVFLDLDGNGTDDLNLSLWPTGDPSYLARWTGSEWSNVRQLPELVQTSLQFSIRLSLAELQSAAAVGVGRVIGVSLGSWTTDPSSGQFGPSPDDQLPNGGSVIRFALQKPGPPRLAVKCVAHKLTARVTAAEGSTVSWVIFTANGASLRMTKPPYVVRISGRSKIVTVTATVRTEAGTRTLRVRARACR
jgi:hypothetical protein